MGQHLLLPLLATSDVSFPEAYVNSKMRYLHSETQSTGDIQHWRMALKSLEVWLSAVITGGASVLPQAETLAGRAALGATRRRCVFRVEYTAQIGADWRGCPDLVKGALVGGAIGGALPLAGQAVKSGWQAMRGGSPAAAAVQNAVEDVAQQADNVRPAVPQFEPVQMQVNPTRQKFRNLLHGLKFRRLPRRLDRMPPLM